MTDIGPSEIERDRGAARLVIQVEDPFGDFGDPIQRARVRSVIETVALAIFEGAIDRLIDRAPTSAQATTLRRLQAGEAVDMRALIFWRLSVRLDRTTAALTAKIEAPIFGPVHLAFPLAADLELHEGSIKGWGLLGLGVLIGAILEPAIEDSKPGSSAKASIQQAIDAGWDAAGDAVNAARRALDEMDLDGDVHREGDHIVIVLRRREEDDDAPRIPPWK